MSDSSDGGKRRPKPRPRHRPRPTRSEDSNPHHHSSGPPHQGTRGGSRIGRRDNHQSYNPSRISDMQSDHQRGQGRGNGSRHGQQHQRSHGGHRPPRGGRSGSAGAAAMHSRSQEDSGHGHTRTAKHWQKHEVIQLASQSSEVILDKVMNEEESFQNAFKYQKFLDNPRVLQCLTKILYSITSSASDDVSITPFATKIISKVFTVCDSFKVKILLLLQSFKFLQSTDENDLSCLRHVFGIAKFSVQRVSSSTLLHFPHDMLQSTFDKLIAYSNIVSDEEYQDYVEEYEAKIEELKISQQKQQPAVTTHVPLLRFHRVLAIEQLHDSPPPNDYTKCSILPEAPEINDPEHKPYLRTNLIDRDYHSTNHYLDVQFRLLREDFIGPLRDGIESLSDVRPEVTVYRGVRILEPICLYNGVGFQIQFDLHESHLDRVRWEHSRRLIYGSLLCLSSDDFKNILFATVVNRDAKLLKERGRFTVKFEGEKSHIAAFHSKPSHKYTMIESSAYFEAYRHVLEGLQQVVPDQMPFQPYLVRDCPSKIPSPLWLRNNSCFNLSSVLEYDHDAIETHRPFRLAPTFLIRRNFDSIDVKRPSNSWPDQTSLDDSQLKALQMALSQELSIIQGPPGTGKTFIGLKVVQALLENREVWDPSRNSPILVICYTNHALDQFLEGIVSNGPTSQVIRIGGRCKSELLKPLVLSNIIKEMRMQYRFSSRIAKPLTKNRANMGRNRDKFEETLNNIDLLEGTQILSLDELISSHVINPIHHRQLQLIGTGQESIEVWLELIDKNMLSFENDDLIEIDRSDLEENSDDDLIDVIDEPQILEDDRLEDGEEYNFTMNSLKREADRKRRNKKSKKATSVASSTNQQEDWQQVTKPSQKRRRRKIDKWMKETPMTADEVLRVRNILNLSLQNKWRLYLNWVNEFIMSSKSALSELAEEYNSLAADCKELDEEINIEAMGDVDIIGMTTTGAAKHNYMLNKLNPKIVLVEEAAEVMEAHIVTSLPSSVQQLILIGDHKQLQPKPAYFPLEKRYDFNISLFERLIKKGVPHVTLTKQHRMRPEIARIVGNHVYEGKLLDAQNVKKYPPVKGVGANLFFIEHNHREKSDGSDDNQSHSNVFEADYVTGFTNHLLKQGYKTNQITILTMYRGQLLEIKQRMKKKTFEGIKVAAVDDFQGEENDIIILSLVRSNTRNSVGFLKIENRVCVALSRAKHGMFVIGDFSMLRDKRDTIWPRLLEEMEKNKFLSDALPLCCQNHSVEKTLIKTPEGFSNLSNGGCEKLCGIRLKCGHVCKNMCHPMDLEHKSIYKCTQKCGKRLSCGHLCSQRCFKCSDSKGCGPCKEKVSKQHSLCGHLISMLCSTDPMTVKCMEKCKKRIGCDHPCTNKCSEKCISEDQCQVPCTAKLKCGHKCKGSCGRCNKGRLHVPCSEKCQRILECGHICGFPCTQDCPPCEKRCRNYCFHSKCPKKCHEPCEPCREPCKWKCKHYECTTYCGEICNRPPCNKPCRRLIKECGHQCIGLCGEKCPKLCRICDRDQVEEVFFGTEADEDARFIELEDCGHIFEVSGIDRWMDLEDRGTVQFRECPRCKTPIRRSLRYGNTVKAALQEMEKVKKEKVQSQLAHKNLFRQQSLCHQVQVLIDAGQYEGGLKLLKKIFRSLEGGECRTQYLDTIENQLAIIPMLTSIACCIDQISVTAGYMAGFAFISKDCLSKDFQRIERFIDNPLLSSQQGNDAEAEVRRVLCLSMICQCRATLIANAVYIDDEDTSKMTSLAQLLMEMGWKEPPPSDKMLVVVKAKVEEWKRKYMRL